MRKIYNILILILIVAICTASAFPAFAEEKVEWTSNHFSVTETNGVVLISGTSTYGNRVSTAQKIDLDGYELKIDLDFDFDSYSFDWMAVIFSPTVNPYLSSASAVSLVMRLRGNDLICSIMNFSLTDLTFVTVRRTETDEYTIGAQLNSDSIVFTINGTEISTDSSSINYKLLQRGVYNSIGVNGAPDFQDSPFTLRLSKAKMPIHDSSKDVIVYGSSISIDDERIKPLLSDNFKVVEVQKETGCQCFTAESFIGLIAIALSIIFLRSKKKRREI